MIGARIRWPESGPLDPETAACMRVHFVLPKGTYEATVLAAALTMDESCGANGARDDEESTGEFTD